MAQLRKEDILQMSMADLEQKLADDQELLMKLRFNHAVSPLDNPLALRHTRREVARLKTEIRRRETEKAAE
jgi:large subunit ribosomal protein L29